MNNTSSLRTVDAWRLAKAPQWAAAYRQDRTTERPCDETPRTTGTNARPGVVVPFRQRA